MPKIGLQSFDIYEDKKFGIGNPLGFCALWSIWYTEMRLKYPNIERKSLIKKIIKDARMNDISFRSIIRNYSVNITSIRDKLLKSSGITINDWHNDQFTETQYKEILSKIKTMLN